MSKAWSSWSGQLLTARQNCSNVTGREETGKVKDLPSAPALLWYGEEHGSYNRHRGAFYDPSLPGDRIDRAPPVPRVGDFCTTVRWDDNIRAQGHDHQQNSILNLQEVLGSATNDQLVPQRPHYIPVSCDHHLENHLPL